MSNHSILHKVEMTSKCKELVEQIAGFKFSSNGGPREAVILFSSSVKEAGRPVFRLNRATIKEIFGDDFNVDEFCEVFNRHMDEAKDEILSKIDKIIFS